MIEWPVEDRFWSKVEKTETCWLFRGCRQTKIGLDYGGFAYKGQTRVAHRVAWELSNGEIPGKLFVLHKCDVPRCVRPDHLYLGTQKDNMRDASLRGRLPSQKKSHCVRGHAFLGANTAITPSGKQRCRTCCKLYQRGLRAKRRALRNNNNQNVEVNQ